MKLTRLEQIIKDSINILRTDSKDLLVDTCNLISANTGLIKELTYGFNDSDLKIYQATIKEYLIEEKEKSTAKAAIGFDEKTWTDNYLDTTSRAKNIKKDELKNRIDAGKEYYSALLRFLKEYSKLETASVLSKIKWYTPLKKRENYVSYAKKILETYDSEKIKNEVLNSFTNSTPDEQKKLDTKLLELIKNLGASTNSLYSKLHPVIDKKGSVIISDCLINKYSSNHFPVLSKIKIPNDKMNTKEKEEYIKSTSQEINNYINMVASFQKEGNTAKSLTKTFFGPWVNNKAVKPIICDIQTLFNRPVKLD